MEWWSSTKEYFSALGAGAWWFVMALIVGILGGVLFLIQQFAPRLWAAAPFLSKWPPWVPAVTLVLGVPVATFTAFHTVRVQRDQLKRQIAETQKVHGGPQGIVFNNSWGNTVVNPSIEFGKSSDAEHDEDGRTVVTAAKLFGPGLYAKNQRFENIRIIGPAIIVLRGGTLRDCAFPPDSDPESLVWEVPSERFLLGAFMCDNCTFENCAFHAVAFGATPKDAPNMRKSFGEMLATAKRLR